MKPQKSYLKLLLIILGVVIVGSGLYYYFGIYKGIKGSSSVSLASPTPSKSTGVSPSGNTGSNQQSNTSGGNNSGNTQNNNTDNSSQNSPPPTNKTFSGTIAQYQSICTPPTITFEYPSDYQVSLNELNDQPRFINVYKPSNYNSGVVLNNGYELARGGENICSEGSDPIYFLSLFSEAIKHNYPSFGSSILKPDYYPPHSAQFQEDSNSHSALISNANTNNPRLVSVKYSIGDKDLDAWKIIINSLKIQ